MTSPQPPASPSWSPTTKLVIGLSLVGIIAALLFYFRSIIGLLLLAFIITYLLHPVAVQLDRRTNLNWRMSVNLIYLLLLVIAGGLIALLGVVIVNQAQSLIHIVQTFISDTLPQLLTDLSTKNFTLGPLPFEINLNQFDLQALGDQLLGTLQTTLGRAGTLVGSLATGVALTFGRGLFVLLISYFILADAGQFPNILTRLDVPGYQEDLRRISVELKRIWNSFLRGQIMIFLLVIAIYTVLMSVLGMQYSLAIAILAGLGRFVPYVGPLIVWIVVVLVGLLQGNNNFGLPPWQFTVLVLVLAIIVDQIIDNYIGPRIMGHSLGVHPAAVLVAALIAANLIGIAGLLLAAPVLATLKLLGRYVVRKLLDLDPWPATDQPPPNLEYPWAQGFEKIMNGLRFLKKR
jgi:predicted PurR-regulated permease PerM